jgi:hypothetical protein
MPVEKAAHTRRIDGAAIVTTACAMIGERLMLHPAVLACAAYRARFSDYLVWRPCPRRT